MMVIQNLLKYFSFDLILLYYADFLLATFHYFKSLKDDMKALLICW